MKKINKQELKIIELFNEKIVNYLLFPSNYEMVFKYVNLKNLFVYNCITDVKEHTFNLGEVKLNVTSINEDALKDLVKEGESDGK